MRAEKQMAIRQLCADIQHRADQAPCADHEFLQSIVQLLQGVVEKMRQREAEYHKAHPPMPAEEQAKSRRGLEIYSRSLALFHFQLLELLERYPGKWVGVLAHSDGREIMEIAEKRDELLDLLREKYGEEMASACVVEHLTEELTRPRI